MNEYIINGTINDQLELNGKIGDSLELNGRIIQDDLIGTLEANTSMDATISDGLSIMGIIDYSNAIIKGEINIGNNMDYEYYNGSYTVIPRIDDQILPVGSKLMRDNLTVKEIPYFETSNEYGKTVYIGNEVQINGN